MNQLTVSLWRDEAFSVFLAKHNLWDIVTLTSRDQSPPLYYFILHFWMNFFGSSEIALRSFSLLSFILLILTVYFFAKEIFKSKKSGIFAAILTLFNPFIFLYAFETRMYMLLMLLTVLSMWFFITKRWFWYVPTTLAAIYTHNFAVLIILVQCFSYLVSVIGKDLLNKEKSFGALIKNQFKSSFVKSLVIVFIFYLPWIPILFNQIFKVTGDFWISKPDLSTLGMLYVTLTAGYEKFFGFIFVLVSAMLLFILRGFKRNRDEVFYYWLILPPLIIFGISQFGKSIFFDRYLVICAPVIPLMLASQMKNDLLNKWFKKIQVSTILLLTIILLLIFADIYSFNHPAKQPFRELADFVKNNYPSNQLIINYYNDRLHYFELKYYGINVKIYSPIPIPFWNGTVLVDQKDIIKGIPSENNIIVMASQNIENVKVPGYAEINRRKFNDLYLFWFTRIENEKI